MKDSDLLSSGLLTFDPDPERESVYYSIYKDGQLIGRSNRECALNKLLLNVKLSHVDGLTIKWDDDEEEYRISSMGIIVGGLHGHTMLASKYLQEIYRVYLR